MQRIDVVISDGSDCAWLIQVTGTISKDALTELKKAIDLAESYDLNLYVDDENKTSFQKILAEAKNIYDNNDTASQVEIDVMTKKLLDATASLRLRADKGNLEQWLEDLKAIDLSQYTEASAAAVRAVIAKAEALAAQDLDENDQGLINAIVAEMIVAKAQLVPAPADGEDPENPNPEESSDPGESSNPDTGKPDGGGSSQNGTNSEGKEVTDDVPTTGDATPIAGLSLLAVAAAGTVLLLKKRKN